MASSMSSSTVDIEMCDSRLTACPRVASRDHRRRLHRAMADAPLQFSYGQGDAHDLARAARVFPVDWHGAGATEADPFLLSDSP
eukprot:4222968-Prymnesium_polylepis.1